MFYKKIFSFITKFSSLLGYYIYYLLFKYFITH